MATTETTTALSTVLQLAYARTVVVRDVDASLEGHHGLGLNDLALLLELALRRPTGACAASTSPTGSASRPPAWPASSRRSSAGAWSGASRIPTTPGSRSSC